MTVTFTAPISRTNPATRINKPTEKLLEMSASALSRTTQTPTSPATQTPPAKVVVDRNSGSPFALTSGAILIEKYPGWVKEQRQQLCRFLEMTPNNPAATFRLPLPVGYPISIVPKLSSASQLPQQSPVIPAITSGTVGAIILTRQELLNLLRKKVQRFYKDGLAERERLVQTKQVTRITSWRWKKETAQNHFGTLEKLTGHLFILTSV